MHGRKPINGHVAMSPAERQRRRRQKLNGEDGPTIALENSAPLPDRKTVAELLAHIAGNSEDLLDLGNTIMALPLEAENLLEDYADGQPVDRLKLTRVLIVAAQLEERLSWDWLKATAAMFRDYRGFHARLEAGRAARLKAAKSAA